MKAVKFLIILLASLGVTETYAFCGFYVAKTDANLFNNKSEVIYVRDGKKSTITMSNDFDGEVKDFAMVVPVPVVLEEQDIKVVDRGIFEKLHDYSAPRIVEYYDQNPCQPVYEEVMVQKDLARAESVTESLSMNMAVEDDYQVTIEAEYEVGEYDILILSAKESDGLKRWLIDNGYKIPNQAEEVLQPYIRSKMKFFVVKVNLEKYNQSGFEYLSPIQISFEDNRFMLPLRLGMANSKGSQDMLMYFFTKNGRVESTNYRTVEVPSNRNIPLFVEPKFQDFYRDLFKNAYHEENENAVFVEYAWDVSPSAGVKCDPCVSPPPVFTEFQKAGVDWVSGMNRSSQVFFTRLHVRYTRNDFPQDLFFQETPNSERFQGRYVITHPAKGDFSCDEGQAYLKELERRRKKEMDELVALTGWKDKYGENYVKEFSNRIKEESTPVVSPSDNDGSGGGGFAPQSLYLLSLLALVGVAWMLQFNFNRMEV
ncbi:DUF2330 domain-containing protein [Halocola ammonii]